MALIRTSATVALTVVAVVAAGCGGQEVTAGGTALPPPPPSASPVPSPPPPPVATGSATTAASAPTASASPPNPQGAELAEGDEHRMEHHGGVLALVSASIKDLDLGADQRANIEKIRSDLLAKMEPARAAGKDLANLLADGVAAGAVDRAKADAAINKLVAQVQGLHDASVAALNQLHEALNAQQRAQLVDGLQSHWEKWKEAHGRDEQDDKQHRSGYLLALVREIGLTKEQAEKIKANFRDRMKASPQDHAHKEVQDHLKAFATAFKADKFDAKSLAGAKSANGHMARWGAARRARFLEAAAPVLTPEQRTKLSQIIRDHANHAES